MIHLTTSAPGPTILCSDKIRSWCPPLPHEIEQDLLANQLRPLSKLGSWGSRMHVPNLRTYIRPLVTSPRPTNIIEQHHLFDPIKGYSSDEIRLPHADPHSPLECRRPQIQQLTIWSPSFVMTASKYYSPANQVNKYLISKCTMIRLRDSYAE